MLAWKVPLHPLPLLQLVSSCLHHMFTHLPPIHRTVLLMNPGEVPADFLSVAEQLSRVQHSQKETYVTLIKHAFQSTLGTKYPLHSIHRALQVRVWWHYAINSVYLQLFKP